MLYRQYNPFAQTGTHNYTTSKSENDNLDKQGWNAEGTAWYGVEHATHTWVTVNHPAVTHEEPIYETKTTSPEYCKKHKVKLYDYGTEPADWLGWCPADKNCLANYERRYFTEKVQTGTKTVIHSEAYTETKCTICAVCK